MMQAKPTDGDMNAMTRLLIGMEAIFDRNENPDVADGVPFDEEDAYLWFRQRWKQSGPSFTRVFWAGRTAIDNACDPESEVLAFKPEIVAARKDAARYRALCRYEMAAASAYSAISGNTVCPGEMDYEAWLDHELDKILDATPARPL